MKICVFILLCLSTYGLHSAPFQEGNDTLKTQTIDTIGIQKPIKFFGGFSLLTTKKTISKEEIVAGDFVSVQEAIQKFTFYQLLSWGTLGYSSLVNSYGVIGNLEMFENGARRNLLPQNYSSFELFPVLSIDSVEIFFGSSSEITARNSNGISVNIQTRKFNTKIPYTQIWIGQAGYEYLGSSGVFSQNVAKNLNFHILYQRYWSAGRYNNSNSDRWNVILGLRWFPNERLNLYLQNKYSVINNALFGGLNPERSTVLFDNSFSVVNFENLNRKTTQNDFSFNYFYYLSNDSSAYVDGGLLFSVSKNEFDFEDYFANYFSVAKNSSYSSNLFNISSKFNFSSLRYKIIVGLDIEKRNQQEWLFFDEGGNFVPNTFAIVNFNLSKRMNLQFGGKVSKFGSEYLHSVGGNINFNFDKKSKIYIDLSLSKKEKSSIFSRSLLGIFGFNWIEPNFKINFEIFARQLANYKAFTITKDSLGNVISIVPTEITNDVSVFGSNFLCTVNIWAGLNYTTKFNLNYFATSNEQKEWLPLLDWKNSLFYRLSRGRSYVDIGLEFELFSPFKGLYFHPLYYYPVENQTKRNWQNNGINAFASAKLGNAYLNVSLRNVLSSNFYLLPIYPEYDRNIRITVFWSFGD
ncbi:MAG: hypothetical protein CH6_4217 [Candidatus Kapaibacterium sp.]|nr:MAG: hypothetical protein CH6_4217 [Candidatus Kapabacteria bacterium]